jgi:bifunctional UDP-N-acetylglucosamine pyrophosphorylase/glucosamine-1-phosphate N-acetyltransferase
MENVQIIILAAGKGTRMESDRPKALTPLRDKPFLKHVLSAVEGVGLPKKPIIVVGHKKEDVMSEIGGGYNYAIQEEQLGTGHAVKIAREHVGEDVDTIVVLFSDQPLMKTNTIVELIDKHRAHGATITMATTDIGDYDEWRKDAFDNFGKIVRDSDGNILRIVERKSANEEEQKITEVNPAYFVFDAAWMWEKLNELKNENSQQEYYLVDLPEMAFKEGKKIITHKIPMIEALGANTKAQLELIEKLFDQ